MNERGTRRNRTTVAVVLMMTLLAGTSALGASGDPPPERRAGVSPRHCPEGEGVPLAPPDALLDILTCRLSLSADQQSEIGALLWKEWELNMALLKKIAHVRRQLRAAEELSTFDEPAFRKLAAGQAASQVELSVSGARVRSRIRALLTASQRRDMERLPPLFPPHEPFFHPPGRDGRGAGHRPPPCGARGINLPEDAGDRQP